MIPRSTVLEAAKILKLEQDAKALRAVLKGGKHQLRLYAFNDREMMESEIAVDTGMADRLVSDILVQLRARLRELGVST